VRFRREALRALESPEKLDEAVRLTSVPSWLATVAALLVVVAAGVWATREAPSRPVDAPGVLAQSASVTVLDATVRGQVVKLWARPNQRLRTGDKLYTVRLYTGAVRTVLSPSAANLLAYLVAEGEVVGPGSDMARLERLASASTPVHATVYVPAASVGMIRPGMPAQVAVESAPDDVFGTVPGAVASIGKAPETPDSLRGFLGPGADPGRLLGAGSVIAVTLTLSGDADSPTGLRWSKTSPSYRLNPRSAVTARFQVRGDRLIDTLAAR
jgi:multidrug efflux pump subunit AcrA (membrane-fusion protein)